MVTRARIGATALALAGLGSAPAIAPAAAPLPHAVAQSISNERFASFWAHPTRIAPVYPRPSPASRPLAMLHHRTEDGLPEVYAVLARYVGRDSRPWLRVGVPGRPNGRTGWVARSALGRLHRVYTELVINRHTLRGALYRQGRVIWNSPIGVGKASTPTPAGAFWIRERFFVRPANTLYGPLAFGTSAYSSLSEWPGGGVIGIHGTNAPGLIPGRPSHGCIRVPNSAILRLGRLMPVGTPVHIL